MRLNEKYKQQVVPVLVKEQSYANGLAAPKLEKATINCGISAASKDDKLLETVVNTLTRISGQKPVYKKARKSISAFKIREGMTVGVAVTLRGQRMYDFVDKLVNIALPRVRDFQGLDRSIVDDHGNMSLGFKEHIVFPEIHSDEVERIHGLEINITTSAKDKKEGMLLFQLLGFPFKKE